MVLWGMARGVAVPWGVTTGGQGAGMALGVQGCSAVGMLGRRDAGQCGVVCDCRGDTGGGGVTEQGEMLRGGIML